MQIIMLTRGFGTLVDDKDYVWLSKKKWYAQGPEGRPARRITIPKRHILFMYHEILEVYPWELRAKGLCVDHIDRNPLNNCRHNLRIVTTAANMQNTVRSRNRIGVCYDKRHRKWKAYLDNPNMPRLNLGTFKTREEAETSVQNARKRSAR
jgi:hypothetical protein